MPEKKVVELDDTGNVVVDERGVANTLTGVAAIRQNVKNLLAMHKNQGYLGATWGGGPLGLNWRGEPYVLDEEPIIGGRLEPEVVALLAAGEAVRAPGVRAVSDVQANQLSQAERANREIDLDLKVIGGTEEFPTPVTVRFRRVILGV